MDSTRSSSSSAAATKTAQTLASQENVADPRRSERTATAVEFSLKSSGYGLPCAKCHLYYPADVDVCPCCHSTERVSPVPASAPKLQIPAEEEVDAAALEQEREEFLRQFKSQLFAAHAEVSTASASMCTLSENHAGDPESAEICKPCYEKLQERVDVYEAALHMDMKEAAQIIYDAVWADPSDPSKTYRNAAGAILTELRRRAGITSVLGPFQPLTH